jgi:hypothetical protein
MTVKKTDPKPALKPRNPVRLRDVLNIDIPRLHSAITSDGVDANPAARVILRALEERQSEYKTKTMYCPPLPLFWNFIAGDGSAASVVHKAYTRALWKDRGFAGRVGLLVHFLAWPPIVLGTMAWFTALNGPAIRRRTGKGIARQLADQFRLAAVHAILPPWYYMFDLFDDELLARAGGYLRRDETKGGIYRMLKSPNAKRGLQNKARFAERCYASGVRTPEHLLAKNGIIRDRDRRPVKSLPQIDLFAKPTDGRGGRGIEAWIFDGSGWSTDDGAPIGESALMEHFGELSRVENYLIQHRLVPHPELRDLSCDILTTVRIVTIRDEHGGHEATHAVFRMPTNPNAKVDNFHAGGLAAKVDIETGELSRASDIGLRPDSTWQTHHPYTGAQIAGRKLPYWSETLDLTRRAHAALPHWVVIGWDVAIVDDGPVVVEGNSGSDLDIVQRSHREPIGDSRFGELLAYHLRNLHADQ